MIFLYYLKMSWIAIISRGIFPLHILFILYVASYTNKMQSNMCCFTSHSYYAEIFWVSRAYISQLVCYFVQAGPVQTQYDTLLSADCQWQSDGAQPASGVCDNTDGKWRSLNHMWHQLNVTFSVTCLSVKNKYTSTIHTYASLHKQQLERSISVIFFHICPVLTSCFPVILRQVLINNNPRHIRMTMNFREELQKCQTTQKTNGILQMCYFNVPRPATTSQPSA